MPLSQIWHFSNAFGSTDTFWLSTFWQSLLTDLALKFWFYS